MPLAAPHVPMLGRRRRRCCTSSSRSAQLSPPLLLSVQADTVHWRAALAAGAGRLRDGGVDLRCRARSPGPSRYADRCRSGRRRCSSRWRCPARSARPSSRSSTARRRAVCAAFGVGVSQRAVLGLGLRDRAGSFSDADLRRAAASAVGFTAAATRSAALVDGAAARSWRGRRRWPPDVVLPVRGRGVAGFGRRAAAASARSAAVRAGVLSASGAGASTWLAPRPRPALVERAGRRGAMAGRAGDVAVAFDVARRARR